MLNKCAQEGYTVAQTARKLSLPYQTIRRASIRHNICFKQGQKPPTKREAVLNALLHVDIKALAKQTKCTQSYCWQIIAEIKAGIEEVN
jgi:hypothetical protein